MREMKKSSIPFCKEIPSSWEEIPNRYLFFNHSQKVGENSNEYQLLSLTTSGIKEKNPNSSGGKVPESYDNYQTVEKGDMVFCLFDLDVSAVFSGLSRYDGMITSAYDVFKAKEKYADNHFLDYWFQYVFSNRYYKMFSKNIRYTITSDMFKSIYTPIPPLNEQKKIGSILDEQCQKIDALIANEEAQIEKLKEYKQSFITEVVTKGLDPNAPMKDSGVKWIGEMPAHWDLVAFGHVLKERNEKNSPIKSTERLSLSIDLGVTLYAEKTTNLDRFKDNFEQYKLAHIGDLVLNSMNMIVGASGVSPYYGCVSPAYYTFYDDKTDHITAKFCEYIFRSKTMKRVLYSLGKGIYAIVRGDDRVNTCRLKVSRQDLRSILIPLPSFDEQRDIVTILNEKSLKIDELISIKENKIESLNRYKKSIIYEYVTGKKEVQ